MSSLESKRSMLHVQTVISMRRFAKFSMEYLGWPTMSTNLLLREGQ
jgi:hypothetical protein